MTDRVAHAADNLAAAVRHVAIAVADLRTTTAADEAEDVSPATPAQHDEPAPLASAPPLLLRLEHGVRFMNEDAQKLQPTLGASATVGSGYTGRRSSETRTVWLPAAAWQGIGTIVRQTPNRHRNDVATFLEALHMCMATSDSAISGLLAEVIDEVRSDPYRDEPEADPGAFDFTW